VFDGKFFPLCLVQGKLFLAVNYWHDVGLWGRGKIRSNGPFLERSSKWQNAENEAPELAALRRAGSKGAFA